jgi:hypothetical protein
MAKFANDLIMDAAFDFVIAEAERIVVATGDAAFVYASLAAITLADNAIGTITKANGDTNGRKANVPQHTAVPIDSNGTATHVHVVDDTGTRILLVTTCTSQVLTSGGTVTIPTWDEEIGDPT